MTRILDTIDQPAQLKALSPKDLALLAQEMRQEIIETVALRGGHLAPNLGTIELTLALHIAFDTPNDLLVWDIGHQAYPHKLVTGRRDKFRTIKQFGGLSGYLLWREPRQHLYLGGVGHGGGARPARREILGRRGDW